MAGVKGKSGGRREGGGRKPKAFTLLTKRIQSEQVEDADYAFSLYASVMRDVSQPLTLRLDCANWVSNRVLGLPKAKTELSSDPNAPIVLKVVYGTDGQTTPTPPETV